MDKLKFKLVIAYDGSGYEGWQAQKIGTGVQQIVETALAKLFPSAPRLHSSSRTDTGVHALGMVAHFEIPRAEFKMAARRLALAINAWLPDDVRVVSASGAKGKFHARFDAGGKQYRYFVWNHAAMNPLLRRTAWHVPRKLDLKAMRAAAKLFVGRRDFKSFAGTQNYEMKTTVRRLTRCDVKKSGAQFTFPPEEIKAMLAKRDRRVAGMTAPAHGLVLWKVFYLPQRRRGAERKQKGKLTQHLRISAV